MCPTVTPEASENSGWMVAMDGMEGVCAQKLCSAS
jgi:hypothetical protein